MRKSNVIFMPVFTGPIAEQLTGFLAEKRNLGYKYSSESWRLMQIDRLSIEMNIAPNTLPQELIDVWSVRTPHESNKTWHARMTVATQLMNYFVSRDLPCAKTMIRTDEIRVSSAFIPYIFSREEIKRLFIAADTLPVSSNSPNRRRVASLLIRMLYACGLRIGEALSLTVKDVDLKQNVITVHGGKGNVDRYVPMSEELSKRCRVYLTEASLQHADADPFFIAPDGGMYSKGAIAHMWDEILRRAEIRRTDAGPRIHDLRHTFSVHCLKQWVDNGVNVNALLPVLSSYLGHIHLSSVNRYLRLTADIFPDITKAVERYIGNIVPDGGNIYEEE